MSLIDNILNMSRSKWYVCLIHNSNIHSKWLTITIIIVVEVVVVILGNV
jgi:hypothetical protein